MQVLRLHITWDQQCDEFRPSSANAGNRIPLSCNLGRPTKLSLWYQEYLDLGIQKGTVQLQLSRSTCRLFAGPRAIIEPSLLWRCVCMNQME
jgi:hypothetical protein